MRSRIKKIVAFAVIPVTVLIALMAYHIWDRVNSFYLQMAIRSSESSYAQIFYDIGKGFNADDAAMLPVPKSSEFTKLSFPLPSVPIFYLRFDPLSTSGQLFLKDIAVVNGLNQLVKTIPLESVQPKYQIKQIALHDTTVMIETIENAIDPMVLFAIDYPLILENRVKKTNTIIAYGAVIILCGLFIIGSVLIVPESILVSINKKVKGLAVAGQPLNKKMNWIVFIASAAVNVFIACYVWHHWIRPPQSAVFQGEAGDYALSFYNQDGQRITQRTGTLKLVMDPFTIYRNYPNQKSGSYSIDAQGFRKGYVSDDKSELVAVIGGSAVFGQGLDDDSKTFSSLLSQYSWRYNSVNAGVVGFLSGQELIQMVYYLDDLHPSLYIVFDGWNDMFDPFCFARQYPVKVCPIGFNNSFFMIEKNLTEYYIQGNTTASQEQPLPGIGTPLDETAYWEKVQKTYLANIDKMNAFATSRNARFLMVFQPELGNKKILSPQEEDILKTWDHQNQYLKKEFPEKYKRLIVAANNFCEQNQIACIDINREAEFTNNPNTLFYDVVHPNELGHEVIAGILSKAIEKTDRPVVGR